ncbi:hypothetical protein DNTS_024816 [Danionella cerebrum]|uniref:Growth hormone-regulated TBC protein 1 n=1 Tax=Danionella cerebrum TaxID=2873325 RepID=A0A553QRY0_9TELE|nr:hypothetical protein DNTS_024816 [Danionella translucida]
MNPFFRRSQRHQAHTSKPSTLDHKAIKQMILDRATHPAIRETLESLLTYQIREPSSPDLATKTSIKRLQGRITAFQILRSRFLKSTSQTGVSRRREVGSLHLRERQVREMSHFRDKSRSGAKRKGSQVQEMLERFTALEKRNVKQQKQRNTDRKSSFWRGIKSLEEKRTSQTDLISKIQKRRGSTDLSELPQRKSNDFQKIKPNESQCVLKRLPDDSPIKKLTDSKESTDSQELYLPEGQLARVTLIRLALVSRGSRSHYNTWESLRGKRRGSKHRRCAEWCVDGDAVPSRMTMEQPGRTWSSNAPQRRVNEPSTARERVDSVDAYGFERSEEFDYESYEELMSEYLMVLTRRSIKWSKMLRGKQSIDRSMTVKRYIRKGVPGEHRPLVWSVCSGAQEQMEKHPGYYHSLLEKPHEPKLEESIRTDLHRTFPDNVYFRKSSEPCLQDSLYNVLLAYGKHNRAVGYCQGMNFLAGLLLLVCKEEEVVFWLMEALLGRILPDYYTGSMLGLKVDSEVLAELVRLRVPAVWTLLQNQGVLWTLVVSRWFICLYIDILPIETVLRIWDCLFYEGSKILFRVALTLIRHHQDLILQAQNLPDICNHFKQITRGAYVEDCHHFMKVRPLQS